MASKLGTWGPQPSPEMGALSPDTVQSYVEATTAGGGVWPPCRVRKHPGSLWGAPRLLWPSMSSGLQVAGASHGPACQPGTRPPPRELMLLCHHLEVARVGLWLVLEGSPPGSCRRVPAFPGLKLK